VTTPSKRSSGNPSPDPERQRPKPSRPTSAFTAAVLTISDSSSRGERSDLSGPAVADTLQKHNFDIIQRDIVPDDQSTIEKKLVELSDKVRLIVTTGGTGIAPRDVTPEATRAISEKLLDGIAEHMRREGAKKTPYAALSRGVCAIRGRCLILNLPGSPTGAKDSLQSVIKLLPHALELLSGNTRHD
jgi:molybdopterin adenylyltransferase